jgi:DNA-3-methyladenine glycosylase II
VATPVGEPATPTVPAFWATATAHLTVADPVLGAIMARYPGITLASRGDGFSTLVRSVVGQQISVRAADAVWARVLQRCPDMTPRDILRRRVATLRNCGLSARKVEYLYDLARHFDDGRVSMTQLQGMDDDAVVDCLSQIHGIGRWTAEMFLIFNLLRPNVLPLDDIGLLKAIGREYLDGTPSAELLRAAGRQRVKDLAARWAPYCSVATWYLWRSLDPVPVAY